MKPETSSQVSAAYRAAMQRLQEAGQQQKPATGFAEVVNAQLKQDVQNVKNSEQTSIDALAGKASVQEVVEAISEAEISLQKVTAVRDRLISAYQEIIRMPI